MSLEASFNLINDELSYLRELLEKEINQSKQQCDEYLAELSRLRREYDIEHQNWESSRNVFQQNIVDLENKLVEISDSIPREKEFLECLPYIAFICNTDGGIDYGNKAFYSFFDFENRNSGWFPFGADALDSAKIRGSWAREIELKSKNGEEIIVDARLFSWNKYSGDIGGLIGITQDRTQYIRSEVEKQKLKQELDSVKRQLSSEIISEKQVCFQKELRCVIFGEPGSGKSALINALIGENLLPEGKKTSVPVRCGRGVEKVIIAHYWNGERQYFYRDNATVERVEELLEENGLLWIELRAPDTIIPYNIMIEEASEMSDNVISKADAIIHLSTIRNYPSFTSLCKMQKSLNEGAYGVFLISKIDLENDDYESGKIALTVASKIENAIKQIRRITNRYPKLRNYQILPISSHLKINTNLVVWHLEEVISSFEAQFHHSPRAEPYSLPEKCGDIQEHTDVLTPVIKAFHEQEFQAEFMRFIKYVSGKTDCEKMSCLFISPHRESVNKLMARLAHDISYIHVLDGKENNWLANFEDRRYVKISVPDSILTQINFLIAPEAFDIEENEFNILLRDFVPVVVLELTGADDGVEELENITCKTCVATLMKNRFCVVSGEGTMINSIENTSKNINEWADFKVPLFIYENYNVIMRSECS